MAYPLMAQELLEQREIAVATIQRQNELYESVSQQLQEAREELLKCELRQVGRRQVEAILREEIERHVQKQPCGHPYACVRQVEPWGDDFVQVCAWCESLEKAGAWARPWKRAAKWYRNRLRIEADRADGLYTDNARYREALEKISELSENKWVYDAAQAALERTP